jgi:hypothetical protein
MIVSKKHKIILITPPKTGTHSITNYIKNSGIESEAPVNSVNYPIYHLTLSEICKVYNISVESLIEYKIIQCVRNPYNRMISAWMHQTSILNNNIPFSDLLLKVSENKHLLPNNIDEFYVSFYGDIEHKNKSFKRGNWGGLRFYFEQNWFNDINANIKYFKLENLQNSTKELSEYLNIKISEFPHINKNIKNISESKYKLFYNNIQKDMISEMYNNDIKMFNYEF